MRIYLRHVPVGQSNPARHSPNRPVALRNLEALVGQADGFETPDRLPMFGRVSTHWCRRSSMTSYSPLRGRSGPARVARGFLRICSRKQKTRNPHKFRQVEGRLLTDPCYSHAVVTVSINRGRVQLINMADNTHTRVYSQLYTSTICRVGNEKK